MKKIVLFAAAGLMVAGASAQSLQLPAGKVQMAAKKQNPAVNFSTRTVAAPQPVHVANLRKPQVQMFQAASANDVTSVSDEMYYEVQDGFMYVTANAEGLGYTVDMIMVGGYDPIQFVDKSKNPSKSSWTLKGSTGTETDVTADYRLEDGVTLELSCSPGYMLPAPVLNQGKGLLKKTYVVGEAGPNGQKANKKDTYIVPTYEIQPLSCFSANNMEYSYYGWSGFNEKHYLFGSGRYQDSNTGEKGAEFVGAIQEFPAPISPLYGESVEIEFFSFSEQCIPDGKYLTLDIFVGDDQEPTYTMKAGADNVTYWCQEDGSPYTIKTDDYGDLMMGSIHFAIEGEDAFGTVTEEPFVLDTVYYVSITGFNQEGIDVGMGATNNYAPEDLADGGAIILSDGQYISYSKPLCFDVHINGLFDHVALKDLQTTEGKVFPGYYVNISDDGTSYTNGIFSDLAGAVATTGCDWYTEDGDENYYTLNQPDWATDIELTPYDTGEEAEEGVPTTIWVIGFTAEPLPSDCKGRGQFVFIEGRGVVSDNPMFIYQGDPETAWDMALEQFEEWYASDIKAVTIKDTQKVAAQSYNLYGQPVDASYKGFVISNGNKQIRY